MHELPGIRIRKLMDGELEITRTATPVLHIEKNVVEVQYDLQIKHPDNSAPERVQETHFMRYFTIPEIEWIAAQAGFSIVQTGEFITAQKTSLNTWNLFVVLQKAV